MKFGILTEEELRKASDGKLDNLIDIWHRDLKAIKGEDLEIVLGNRRDSSSPVRGGILTNAVIEMSAGRKRLMIWYDPLELFYESRVADSGYTAGVVSEITEMLKEDRDPGMEYDPVSNPEKLDYDNIARQIGRWLLRVRGFRRLRNEKNEYYELDSFLNTECLVPALYSLLDEAGFDYSRGEEKRLREVYEGLCNMEEPEKRLDRALNALRISNIAAFNSKSDVLAGKLDELLAERFKRVLEVKTEIDGLKDQFDLKDSASLYSFMSKLVLKYRMPGSWSAFDETTGVF